MKWGPAKSGFPFPQQRGQDGKLPRIPFCRGFVGEAALLIDVIASGLPTNQPDEFAGRWAQKSRPVLGLVFGTGRERDPDGTRLPCFRDRVLRRWKPRF
jgi:hypothetical protein